MSGSGPEAANARLAPVVTDPASGGFFAAAAQGRLTVLTCSDCGGRTHLPRPFCVHCGGDTLQWQDIPRRGRVRSWTIVEHQVHPWFPVPYTVVLIDVDHCPEVRMIGYLPGRAEVSEKTCVVADFEDLGADPKGNSVVLPRWSIEEAEH
ncbi:zinc ribbon domain-containing protein [Nocardia sp. CA2R105]|uniref:Zn-ribbon domain-containing OB-fold protein n=1 Tax=Nocardia coffeae TaxID=2873381 RepID=UPI001CA71623|nr:zinc ribbon domain-containing protein [Nocardia coffeae]MBY8857118.1 zinc ribbon domain-containing protein [Nocardia coffeae]